MNFINFNPDARFPEFAFNPKPEAKTESLPNENFSKILEETANDTEKNNPNSIEEKRKYEDVRDNGTRIDEREENKVSETEQEKNRSEKIAKLLDILERLIEKKEISPSEQIFFLQNLPLLKETLKALPQTVQVPPFLHKLSAQGGNDIFKSLSSEGIRLPQEILDQIKKFSQILKEAASSDQSFTNKENLNEPTKSGKISQMVKITDLTGSENREGKKVQMEEIYVKTKDRFDVLKGEIKLNSSVPSHLPADEGKINPTHQKGQPGQTSNGVGVGQIQRNLVINFSSRGDTGFGGEFSGQGFSHSSPSLERASGMFSDNSLPQSINFKSLVQYLTGRIHNGFVNGKQVMLVKLQPENLGQIQVVLKKESENSLHLKLKVDNVEIKDIIDKIGVDIKTGLTKENLDLLSFSVDVSDQTDQRGSRKEDEKGFNEFSLNSTNKKITDENVQMVDLRIKDNMFSIKI